MTVTTKKRQINQLVYRTGKKLNASPSIITEVRNFICILEQKDLIKHRPIKLLIGAVFYAVIIRGTTKLTLSNISKAFKIKKRAITHCYKRLFGQQPKPQTLDDTDEPVTLTNDTHYTHLLRPEVHHKKHTTVGFNFRSKKHNQEMFNYLVEKYRYSTKAGRKKLIKKAVKDLKKTGIKTQNMDKKIDNTLREIIRTNNLKEIQALDKMGTKYQKVWSNY